MRLAKPQAAKRRGFTLIEMLVVIAIIAILASMIIAASMRVIGMQAQKNTNLEVQKLANAIYAQWSAIVEQASNEQTVTTMNGTMSFSQWASQQQPGGDIRVARLLYINCRLAQQLPQNYQEAMQPPGNLCCDPFYMLNLGSANMGDSPAMQSSVCLWLALKNSRNGAVFNQDIFTPQEIVANPSNNQVFCLVDAWRQPLVFQRMPYANYIQVNPQGQLNTSSIAFDLDPNAYPQLYYVPVISSSGPPMMNQPINSYTLTIGGPLGG